jgi:indolepyruvate ferredoxin oxidoreductase
MGKTDVELRIRDKYTQRYGTVFLTGMEAIVRLVLEKQWRDAELGPVNQTYFSGYEGSPLGGLDLKLVEQLGVLNELGRTLHQFGINEKTAASAMLGTQFADSGDIDAFWYGKAHGTMWVPDEVWLANLSGTAARGSMVLLTGEDHRSKSSVSPGASDGVLRSCLVPTFYPASVAEIIELGLHAVALSRHTGVVTALKLVTPVCDGASTINLATVQPDIVLPPRRYDKNFNRIVMATRALPMQQQLVEERLPLVDEYVRANDINRIIDAAAGGSVGIIATGKSYIDVRQALDYLQVRLPILHLRMAYPLDAQIIRDFAKGLERIYLVEEPGPFVEEGVKAALLGTGVEAIYGQWDELGKPFVPSYGEVDPEVLVQLLGPRLGVDKRQLQQVESRALPEYPAVPSVVPMSCGGCPYNSFRDLKEKPGGAIGCSSIRAIPAYDNGVLYIPTMGAGGSIYSGWAPFNGNQHIFQYLGDGSYFHSGRGAIQSCVQGQVNITFLLLFNGVVALTGGQDPGGGREVPDVVRELSGLGVAQVGIVCEDPERYREIASDCVEIFALEEHGASLDSFKLKAGTTVLILDKECATEKGRRRRRQGLKPDEYVLINEELCEGCGDCYDQSEGCAALYKIETEFGDKTQVRQANCAQDKLCIDGECPSFVVAKPAAGVALGRRTPTPLHDLPEPVPCEFDESYTVYAVGRGGTGVVTLSHLLAYAAMIEGKYVYLSNNTGLAQKGGPVEAPIVISSVEQPVFNRLFPGQVDLYLGFDILRAAEPQNLQFLASDRSKAVISTAEVPTAEMNRRPRESLSPAMDLLRDMIDSTAGKGQNIYLDTYWLAEALFADIIYANMLLLGAAYQAGTIPVGAVAIEQAIELNGKAIENNIQAFRWGRLAVADPARVEADLGRKRSPDGQVVGEIQQQLAPEAGGDLLKRVLAWSLPVQMERQFALRIAELCAYQDETYARTYLDFVEEVMRAERALDREHSALTQAVGVGLYKLMAYKDEYEVARLATKKSNVERIKSLFDGDIELSYRLQPPTLRWLFKRKIAVGGWFYYVLCALKRGKKLRGGAWDPFAHTTARRLERGLVKWYRDGLGTALECLREDNYPLVLEWAKLPDAIRGYEGVKERSAEIQRQKAEQLLATICS